MKISFDAYLDGIVDDVNWHPALSPEEVAAEKAAMRARVLADIEASMPARVVAAWKSSGVEVDCRENPGIEVHGMV